jgi:hypothetical protein
MANIEGNSRKVESVNILSDDGHNIQNLHTKCGDGANNKPLVYVFLLM